MKIFQIKATPEYRFFSILGLSFKVRRGKNYIKQKKIESELSEIKSSLYNNFESINSILDSSEKKQGLIQELQKNIQEKQDEIITKKQRIIDDFTREKEAIRNCQSDNDYIREVSKFNKNTNKDGLALCMFGTSTFGIPSVLFEQTADLIRYGTFYFLSDLNTNKEGRLDEAAAIPSCLPNS